MKNYINVVYVVALAFAIYTLTYLVNWKEPKFYDYSMIILYSICLVLVIINIIVYIKKKKG
jgi:hypothetical protein